MFQKRISLFENQSAHGWKFTLPVQYKTHSSEHLNGACVPLCASVCARARPIEKTGGVEELLHCNCKCNLPHASVILLPLVCIMINLYSTHETFAPPFPSTFPCPALFSLPPSFITSAINVWYFQTDRVNCSIIWISKPNHSSNTTAPINLKNKMTKCK